MAITGTSSSDWISTAVLMRALREPIRSTMDADCNCASELTKIGTDASKAIRPALAPIAMAYGVVKLSQMPSTTLANKPSSVD